IRKTNERAILDAGRRFIVNEARYIEYKFGVGIEDYFSVLSNPDEFVVSLQQLVWGFIDSLNDLNRFIPDVASVKEIQEEFLGKEFVGDYFDYEYYKSVDLDFESEERIEELVNLIHGHERFNFENRQNSIDEIKDCLAGWSKSFNAALALHQFEDPRHLSDSFYSEHDIISRSYNLLDQIINFMDSKMARLFIRPFLLLSGEALIGKTHLFCDLVSNHLSVGKKSILLLGHVLSSEDQIEKQLLSRIEGVDSFDELLSDLNIIGDNENYRPTIFIDAINEAGANKVWFEQLQGFIEKVSNHPNISLALSVRDVTKQDVISKTLLQSGLLTEIIHPGLSSCDDSVLSKICEIFNISMPEVPLLQNIDYNPGLLFLFFEGLQSKGIKNIDFERIRPITIFDDLFEGINQNICKKLELDIRAGYVNRCLRIIIAKMFESDERSLNYSEVFELVFDATAQKDILSSLISEGVFNVFNEDGLEKIFFTYQKFENYFVSYYILDQFFETETSIDEFGNFLNKSAYRKVLKEEMILEALAVILP
ncbi:MAG: hypothetical protein LPJ98_03770, partial [Cyclobacteriaceae bacterium]|nr:hypothetical protein [Cyclobacteriaceae bacterium]